MHPSGRGFQHCHAALVGARGPSETDRVRQHARHRARGVDRRLHEPAVAAGELHPARRRQGQLQSARGPHRGAALRAGHRPAGAPVPSQPRSLEVS